MTAKRAEPFRVALHSLRRQLWVGAFGYDRRLAATEIAEQLKLSPTPVREALARLAGEGLVEDRRGQGYFVRRPSGLDVADLYRLSLAHLLLALDSHGPSYPSEGEQDAESTDEASGDDPVVRVERLFEGWVAEGGGWALQEAHQRVQGRLAPVRRREGLLIADLGAEADALAALDPSQPGARALAVRAFHRRRIRLADRLAGLMERRAGLSL